MEKKERGGLINRWLSIMELGLLLTSVLNGHLSAVCWNSKSCASMRNAPDT